MYRFNLPGAAASRARVSTGSVAAMVSLVVLTGACQDTATAPRTPITAEAATMARGGSGGPFGGPTKLSRIFFASERDEPGNLDIYSSNPDGTAVTRHTTHPGIDDEPAVTHDGKRIAFTAWRDGAPMIHILSLDGSPEMLFPQPNCRQATWSPDDTRIVFTCGVSAVNATADIFSWDVYTWTNWRLTNNSAQEYNPSLSPQGELAFVSNRDGRWEIYKKSLDEGTGIAHRLTNTVGGNFKPEWSPNGTRIAFASGRSGNVEVYSMNADGSNQIQRTTNVGSDQMPSWSPNGSQIVFQSYRSGSLSLYVMNADGSAPTRITDFSARNPFWTK
jgi:Tol biopolymer transport system component